MFGILQQMPRLKFVNLSFNVLRTPLRQVEIDRNMKWQELRNLVLNSTYISWESVQDILDCLPGLEELHLSLNEYDNVCLHEEKTTCTCKDKENDNQTEKCTCQDYKLSQKHTGLRILHFNGNPIENWQEIRKLGYAFPNLQTLVLADCPIKSLDVHSECDQIACKRNYERTESGPESSNNKESPHDAFRNLKILNLNSTQLSTWNDIERLSKFPILECVRVQVRLIITLMIRQEYIF